MKEWKYGISYASKGHEVVLYNEPFWCSALKRILDIKPILYVVGYVPGAYSLFNKLIFWLDDKEEVLARIPADADLWAKISPDDEWLWGDSEEAVNADTDDAGV